MPHLDETSASIFGVNKAAAVMPAKASPFRLCRAVENFPFDAHFAHPPHGRVRLVDQQLRQLRHRAPARDAHQIAIKVVFRIGREVDLFPLAIAYMREKRLFVCDPIVHVAELRAVAKPSVAAFFSFRRLFQHEDLSPGAMRRNSGSLSGVPESDNDHVVVFCLHDFSSRLSYVVLANLIYNSSIDPHNLKPGSVVGIILHDLGVLARSNRSRGGFQTRPYKRKESRAKRKGSGSGVLPYVPTDLTIDMPNLGVGSVAKDKETTA